MSQVVQELSHDLLTGPPPATNRPENYLGLDAWRGIAAISVCFYHAGLVIVAKQLNGYKPTLYAITEYGFLGVQVFFVVSGYCIAASAASILKKGKPLSQFVRARLRRIFPACWASLVLGLGVLMLAGVLARAGILHDSTSASRSSVSHEALYWISNVTLTQLFFHQEFISAVHWTLCYEIAFYMLIAIGILVARLGLQRKSADGLLWLLHALTVACLIGLIGWPSKIPYPFDLWPQFGFGVLVFDWLNSTSRRRIVSSTIAVTLLTAAFVLKGDVQVSVMQVSSQLTFVMSFMTAVALVLLRPVDVRLSHRPAIALLRTVGAFSYSLYLTHFTVLGFVNQFVRTVVRSSSYHYVQMFVSVLMAIVAGWLFYLIAEKPFLARSRTLK